MKIKVFYILLFILCLLFLFDVPTLNGQSAEGLYREAIQFIKDKQYDFALLEFRAIIRDFPESKYAQESMFAMGEYFYTQGAYHEAIKNFAEYIRNYPDADGAIFAKAYLLKIMQSIEKPTEEERRVIDNIKTDFFSKALLLLFSEYKEASYKSVFQTVFTVRYYVDITEVYRNGKIFIKITP